MQPSDRLISSLPFSRVERTVEWFVQKERQLQHAILLFETEVHTPDRIFPIHHVQDVSYRPFSSGSGLFYLHTNQGLFSFSIATDPEHFMSSYRKLRGDFFPS